MGPVFMIIYTSNLVIFRITIAADMASLFNYKHAASKIT